MTVIRKLRRTATPPRDHASVLVAEDDSRSDGSDRDVPRRSATTSWGGAQRTGGGGTTESLKPDLVIMDIKMPVRDRIDAASEIAAKTSCAGGDVDRVQSSATSSRRPVMPVRWRIWSRSRWTPRPTSCRPSRWRSAATRRSSRSDRGRDDAGSARTRKTRRARQGAADGEAEPGEPEAFQADSACGDGPAHHHEGRRTCRRRHTR